MRYSKDFRSANQREKEKKRETKKEREREREREAFEEADDGLLIRGAVIRVYCDPCTFKHASSILQLGRSLTGDIRLEKITRITACVLFEKTAWCLSWRMLENV